MKIPAIQIEQNGNTYYLSFFPLAELDNLKLKTDVWRELHKNGYQRTPSSNRVNDFANYIGKGHGTCPLSVLVSIRDNIQVTETIAPYVELNIPQKTNIWIVDGQHRIAGLQKLASEDKKINFSIPIVVIPSWKYEESKQSIQEALEFLIINRTQKGVRPDLAERLISRLPKSQKEEYLINLPKAIRNSLEWAPLAIEVTEKLNNETGVWHKKIRFPNEPKLRTIISQKAFTDSIYPIISNISMRGYSSHQLGEIIKRYWESIHSLASDAFDEPKNYTLQKTTGVYVFHALFPKVISYLPKNSKFTSEAVTGVLQHLDEKIKSAYWANDGPAGQVGTSRKAFSYLRSLLENQLDQKIEKKDDGVKPFDI